LSLSRSIIGYRRLCTIVEKVDKYSYWIILLEISQNFLDNDNSKIQLCKLLSAGLPFDHWNGQISLIWNSWQKMYFFLKKLNNFVSNFNGHCSCWLLLVISHFKYSAFWLLKPKSKFLFYLTWQPCLLPICLMQRQRPIFTFISTYWRGVNSAFALFKQTFLIFWTKKGILKCKIYENCIHLSQACQIQPMCGWHDDWKTVSGPHFGNIFNFSLFRFFIPKSVSFKNFYGLKDCCGPHLRSIGTGR
jgi:hypothetical protein